MGRQRAFDVDEALDAALAVFWRKGYEGTSYTDLTKAIGVERPALYSAFGNKEALFQQALARYSERYLAYFPAALERPTSREVVAAILHGAAELHTRFPDRRGCFAVLGAVAGTDDAEPIRQSLVQARSGGEASLRERLKQAKVEGDLPDSANPTVLAAFVMAVLHGMAVEAKAGRSRDELVAVADLALASWPSARPQTRPDCG